MEKRIAKAKEGTLTAGEVVRGCEMSEGQRRERRGMIGERECPCCGGVVPLKPEEARFIARTVLRVVSGVYSLEMERVESLARASVEMEACFVWRCVSWEMSGISMRRFASMVRWERRTLGYAVAKVRDLADAYPSIRGKLDLVRIRARRELSGI